MPAVMVLPGMAQNILHNGMAQNGLRWVPALRQQEAIHSWQTVQTNSIQLLSRIPIRAIRPPWSGGMTPGGKISLAISAQWWTPSRRDAYPVIFLWKLSHSTEKIISTRREVFSIPALTTRWSGRWALWQSGIEKPGLCSATGLIGCISMQWQSAQPGRCMPLASSRESHRANTALLVLLRNGMVKHGRRSARAS